MARSVVAAWVLLTAAASVVMIPSLVLSARVGRATDGSSDPALSLPQRPRNTTTTTTTTTRSNGTGEIDYPKTWAAKLFYETLVDFSVSEDVGSSACRRQTQMYVEHLKNDSFWAMKMSDSWSRYPNGILVGTTHQMGVYEECVHVHQPVQGKYCLPSVVLRSTTGADFTVGKPEHPGSNDHAWREILGFIDNDRRVHRNNVKFGICIPDSCTASDLEISLQREFDKHFLPHQIKAQVEVKSILCSTDKNTYPYETGYFVTSFLIALLVLLCCLATAYHLLNLIHSNDGKKTHKMPEMLGAFSIIRNTRNLIKYDRTNDLNIFNGLKVFTMVLVLFGHKFLYFVINPIMWGERLEMIYEIGPNFLLTSMNLVDPFFFISGYLMYVLMMPQFKKAGTNWVQVPMVIVYKYLRTLPAYIMMMLLTTYIIPHQGKGPFWAWKIWPEAEKCKNYWWANILAVSNFIDIDNQCLIAGWYISCLLQFLVIGTVVMYVCVKNRKIGVYLIVLLLVVSLILPFVFTYVHRAYGIIRLMVSTFENPKNSYEFRHLYRPFYLRGTPFFAGMLTRVVVEELLKREVKFSTFVVYVGTVIVSTACIWIQLYGAVFYDANRPYDVFEQSLYSTVSHCTWTLILFWVTICHCISGYGPMEKLFNNRLAIPLGRLCYAVYLVNITVMMVTESKARAAISPTVDTLVDGWIFGSIRTYFFGFMLYLLVEAPLGEIIKNLLYGRRKQNNEQVSTENRTTGNGTETEQKHSTHL